MFLKVNAALTTAISLAGTILIYYAAVKSGVSVSEYYAFNVAYGMIAGAFTALAGITLTAAQIRPTRIALPSHEKKLLPSNRKA